MELKLLLTLLKRWAWLLALGLILGGGGGYLASQYQEPVYQASTKVMVIQPRDGTVQAELTPLSDQELVQTYIALLTTRPVLATTADLLNFSISSGDVSARYLAGTRLLEVTVRADDPAQAALAANTLVEVLIAQNDTLQASRFASSEESLQAQIAQVEAQINDVQAQLDQSSQTASSDQLEAIAVQRDELEDQIFNLQRESTVLEQEIDELTPRAPSGELPPPLTESERSLLLDKRTQLAQLRFTLNLAQQNYLALSLPDSGGQSGQSQQADNRASASETALTLYQQLYSNLLNAYESVRLARLQNTPNIVQVEQAVPPSQSIEPRPLTNAMLGAAVGLIIMGAVAFLIEYLDDSIKTPGDIDAITGLPTLAGIAKFKDKEDERELVTLTHPRSPISEAFRVLRTGLLFSTVDHPSRTLLITSPNPTEGKSMTAANLSVVMAQAGHRVLLVDADLRRPVQHKIFSLSNRKGLTSLLLELNGDPDEALRQFKPAFQPSGQENLDILTSGAIPPNPSELLGSAKMRDALAILAGEYDFVIVDSPPGLAVADALVLSTQVDSVLLVVDAGQTRANQLRQLVDRLREVDANIVGVTLNRLSPRGDGYYYYYYYQNSYYYDDGQSSNGSGNGGSRLRRLSRSSEK